MNKSSLIAALCAVTISVLTFTAMAAPITLYVVYSGVEHSPTARATGSITFEDTLLPNPGSMLFALPDPAVIALSLTVTGATIGNGTYGLEDFTVLVWDTGGVTLDLTTELVGQAEWGTFPRPGGGFPVGDFNPCNNTNTAVLTCIGPFMMVFRGTGEIMVLTSMTPENLDADGDGVNDDEDLCPDTAPEAAVDAVGCSDAQVDGDGDGVCNDGAMSNGPSTCVGADACPGTVIPEGVPTVRLGTNRWALVDNDFEFDTTAPKGKGPGRSYSTADTDGCSCGQIIAALELGKGHTKHGCSIGAMDGWVALPR